MPNPGRNTTELSGEVDELKGRILALESAIVELRAELAMVSVKAKE